MPILSNNEFKQRQRFKRILYSRLTLVVLIIVCLFLANGTYGIYQKYAASRANQSELEAQLSDLQSRKEYLQSSVDSLETPEGVSYELQDKFGVAEPGENEIVIVPSTSTPAAKAASEGFFQKLYDAIVGAH